MTQLDHSALPLRHRIYALYCEGRTFTAIARTLWLDRGTVARHVHAIEATLLAEQTETSLAVLRLRAIEAQHAILAAAWDALKFEEHQEYDYERERDRDRVEDHHYTPQPARSRRAQLLATAARAARTAAQLQGLFTPAALTAALRDALRDALPAASAIAPAASAPSTGLPIACNATDRPLTTPPAHPANAALVAPAASCGMPAPAPAPSMASAAPATRESPLGFPGAFISTDRPPTAPPTLADYPANSIRDVPLTTPPARRDDPVPVTPAAFCGMPASAIAPTSSASPLRAGDGPEERSVRRATGLPRAYLM